jgi:hypothetical protein
MNERILHRDEILPAAAIPLTATIAECHRRAAVVVPIGHQGQACPRLLVMAGKTTGASASTAADCQAHILLRVHVRRWDGREGGWDGGGGRDWI